ncbi:hypothetical protein V1286_006815 [Bradyrhizobium algeriense]|uniref:Uncharacterized protein n=1 Tax=Bradyrhizobium algeriense TaxID=634784 RepID=A0ABU8BL48_9BRAD
MIVAPRRRADADEDAINEECHRRLLEPEPGVADGAGDDVAHHQDRESGDGDGAENHQNLFEPVERAPFQVALLLQHEAIESVHDRFSNPR